MRLISFDVESCNGNPKEASLCSFGYCISDENYNILEKKERNYWESLSSIRLFTANTNFLGMVLASK